jgi:hypothetical protein
MMHVVRREGQPIGQWNHGITYSSGHIQNENKWFGPIDMNSPNP